MEDNKIIDLEKRIRAIEERNNKVEKDKAWEISLLRKIIVLVIIYIIAILYLKIADTTNPYLGAIVPCVGFFLSTLTINTIKKHWLNNYNDIRNK